MKNLKLYESASDKSTKFKVVDTFTQSVRNPESTLNNEKGSVIANFEKGDILDITIQSGSLGDLWSISNLSTGESHSMWKYDYSSPRDMKSLKQVSDTVTVPKRTYNILNRAPAKPAGKEMSTEELEGQTTATHTVIAPVEGVLRKGDKVFLDAPGERIVVIKGGNIGMIVDLDADEIKSVLAPLSESTKSTKLKNIQMFENFNTTAETAEFNADQQKAIDALGEEMDWNPHEVLAPTKEDLDIYSHAKGLTPENGLIYWGMAGQSILKDIKAALDKHNIKARVFRGYETTRQSDDHDYIIVLTK